MKIDYYCIGAGPAELERPVAEIMHLFGIAHFGCAKQGDISLTELPAGSVCIFNIVQNQQPAGIRTEICVHNEEGKLKKLVYESVLTDAGEGMANGIKRLAMIHIWNACQELTGITPSPWGILRGVRPTKIVHRLLDSGEKKQNIPELLKTQYLIAPDRAALLTNIAAYHRRWLTNEAGKDRRVSVYIGIPYCPSRCLYCSFPAYVMPEREKFNEFFRALKEDIRSAAATITNLGLAVQTVYIGGGTPTSLGGGEFEELLSLTTAGFVNADTCEFTVEAGRPDSLDDNKIGLMKRYGVTRVSINPQSMQGKTLKLIGRNHTVEDIINIFGKIRNLRIPIVNMDIIAGLPGENIDDFHDTMEKILELDPENITIHTLALKKGSTLKNNRAAITLPDEETTKHMLEVSRNLSTGAGFVPYYLYRQKYMTGNLENVGYAKPGMECIYNIQIMEERQTIIGIGPNAGTKAVSSPQTLKSAYFPKSIDAYISSLNKNIDVRNRVLFDLYERA